MVSDDDQDVLLGPQPQQSHSQKRANGQIERLRGRLLDARVGGLLGIGLVAQIEQLNAHRTIRVDQLVGHPVHDLETRAKRLVTGHQCSERLLERIHIQRPPQACGEWDVVCGGAVGLELIQEPQPLLGKRCG